MTTNYYEVLNVSKNADSKEISEAYKKMALKWHPDKNPDNTDEANRRFQSISQAYQVLSDANKRLTYDRGQSMNHHHHHNCDADDDDDDCGLFFTFFSPEIVFRRFFQQYESRAFCAYDIFNDQHNNRRTRNAQPENYRRKETHSENHTEEMCHIRTVNGKQWMTKTCYENGNKIVTRYEDGELVCKQINGVFQKIHN